MRPLKCRMIAQVFLLTSETRRAKRAKNGFAGRFCHFARGSMGVRFGLVFRARLFVLNYRGFVYALFNIF